MDCSKCSQRINSTDLYTVCEGRCAERFHIQCVSVSEDQLCAFTKNIIWMCDACMKDFWKYRERPALEGNSEADETVRDAINELKNKVADITKTLDLIALKETSSSIRMAPRHSTPISSKLHNGSNVEYVSSHHEGRSDTQTSHRSTDPTFALFMTNIDSQVTEEEIGVMVCQCLAISSTECFAVTKLVPRGRPCSLLDYISFKVVISQHLKSRALSESTWPRGVRFREYENRQNTWKP